MHARELIKNVKLTALIIALASLFLLSPIAGFAENEEEVKISIRSNEYVFPPSEFHGTKEYPDIIIVENRYLRVEVLPNRGLLLWKLTSKLTGNEFLYYNSRPLPYLDELTNTYCLEFGGYYLEFPWNKRDNQPVMLSYEIVEKGPERVVIYLYGEEIETKFRIEAWLMIDKWSPGVHFKINITNLSGKDSYFVFADRIVISTPLEETSIILPTNFIEIVFSKNDWLGAKGTELPWPHPISSLDNFEAPAAFSTKLNATYIAIMNARNGEALITYWKSPTPPTILIKNFGKEYEDYRFDKPVTYLHTKGEDKMLGARESAIAEVHFYILQNLEKIQLASEYAAGYIHVENATYTIEDEVKAKLKISTFYPEKEVKALLRLYNQENALVKEIGEVAIGDLEPGRAILKDLSFKIEGIEPGRYLLIINVFSKDRHLLYLTDSLELIQKFQPPLQLSTTILIFAILAVIIAVTSFLILYRLKRRSHAKA